MATMHNLPRLSRSALAGPVAVGFALALALLPLAACGFGGLTPGSNAEVGNSSGDKAVGSDSGGLSGTGGTSKGDAGSTGTVGGSDPNETSGGASAGNDNATTPANGNTATPDGSSANNVDTGARTFSFGAIIDYDGLGPHGKESVASFVTKTKVTPDVVDSYVRLKSDGTFELDTAKTLINQAAASKVPTVCLSVTSEVQGTFPSAQLNSLIAAVTYGKSVGVAIQVRFGYEMNGYWSPSNKTNGTLNDPTNFLKQWAQVAPAVQKAGGKTMWSPNVPFDTASALARWQPSDASTIDLVGMDYYPKTNPWTVDTARTALNKIYPIAKALNKPLYFGETASVNSGSSIQESTAAATKKMTWLDAITDVKLREEMPLYAGFRWFDYQKYEDSQWNNWSISADPYAASAFSNWYKTSVFVTGQ